MITGGSGSCEMNNAVCGIKSVEIWNSKTGISCLLPNLPYGRFSHSQDGPLLCGDGPYKGGRNGMDHRNDECLKFDLTNGKWIKSHTLPEGRTSHVSWTPPNGKGTYLIGEWLPNKPQSKTSVRSQNFDSDSRQQNSACT